MDLILKIALISILAFLLLFLISMFFLSRIFVPNLGFKRSKIPRKLPKEFEEAIIKLRKQSKNKEDYAKKIYDYLGKRFKGEPADVWKEMPFIFVKGINKLWNKKKLHCNQLNYLYRTALIKSKLFKEEDIKIWHRICMLNLHQILEVNIGKTKEKLVKIDLFAKNYGYGFGRSMPSFFNPVKHWKKRKIGSILPNFFSGFFLGLYYIFKNYIFKRIF